MAVAARVLETLPVGCDTCVPTAVLIGGESLSGRTGRDAAVWQQDLRVCGCAQEAEAGEEGS